MRIQVVVEPGDIVERLDGTRYIVIKVSEKQAVSLRLLELNSYRLHPQVPLNSESAICLKYHGKMSFSPENLTRSVSSIESDGHSVQTIFDPGDVIQKDNLKCLVMLPHSLVNMQTWELLTTAVNIGQNDEWTYLGSLPREETDGEER